MAQGRIKRLQSAERSQFQTFKPEELSVCELCERPIPPALRDAHHLIPKSRGGVITVFMHRACHKQVHALFTETELARHYPSPEALRNILKWPDSSIGFKTNPAISTPRQGAAGAKDSSETRGCLQHFVS